MNGRRARTDAGNEYSSEVHPSATDDRLGGGGYLGADAYLCMPPSTDYEQESLTVSNHGCFHACSRSCNLPIGPMMPE